MDEHAGAAARAAAERLAGKYGDRLPGEVEAALYAGNTRGPAQYFDPVSVARVVAVATLAWTVFSDLRKRAAKPPAAETVTRQVRVELHRQGEVDPAQHEEIISVVVTEIIRIGGEIGGE